MNSKAIFFILQRDSPERKEKKENESAGFSSVNPMVSQHFNCFRVKNTGYDDFEF
jgi:hypothetical protein